LINFKGRDKKANGQLTPKGLERWASPLLFRAFPQGAEFVPLALFLGGARPTEVVAKSTSRKSTRPVRASIGARAKIAKFLGHRKGDALAAFSDYLLDPEAESSQRSKKYKVLTLHPRIGGN
jgi:hypothetical protein